MPNGFVYIVGSDTGTLYIGVTSRLTSRILEHKAGIGSAFTARYGCHRLLYYESYADIRDAIGREKSLKGKTRAKKLVLIRQDNPEFQDIAKGWGWLSIGPAHRIEDIEEELKARIKLKLPTDG
jgi:putative endonuclease